MSRFDRFTVASIAAAALLAASFAASAQTMPVSSTDAENLTETAEVLAVDQATRVVTLKTEEGKTLDVTAGPEVRNLAQVKAGDVVVTTLHLSLTYTLSPGGTKLPEAAQVNAAARAKPGQKPAGFVAQSTSLSGTITAVDVANHTVSVVALGGGPIHTLDVRNPERQAYLPKVKVGDMLTVTYTEAFAIGVVPAKK